MHNPCGVESALAHAATRTSDLALVAKHYFFQRVPNLSDHRVLALQLAGFGLVAGFVVYGEKPLATSARWPLDMFDNTRGSGHEHVIEKFAHDVLRLTNSFLYVFSPLENMLLQLVLVRAD